MTNTPGVPMVFCKVDRMPWYRGEQEHAGAMTYTAQEGARPHEDNIFKIWPDGKTLYGWFRLKQPEGKPPYQLEILKIWGATLGMGEGQVEFARGVTTVWCHAHEQYGTVIAGWYRNSIVYRKEQTTARDPAMWPEVPEYSEPYRIEAPAADARLLCLGHRRFVLPATAFGQQNIWYGRQRPDVIAEVGAYIGAMERLPAVFVDLGKPADGQCKKGPPDFGPIGPFAGERSKSPSRASARPTRP